MLTAFSMTNFQDAELLSMFKTREGKEQAFNILVTTYQEKIYHTVRRLVIIHEDADDIVQNTFIKVWKNIDQFREDSRLYTWVYRIAINEALSFLKSKKIRSLFFMDSYEVKLAQSLTDDNFFHGDEVQRKLQTAILRLPEKQRAVFNMRYFDELSYDEMSEISGTSVGALKASYHIAAKKITEFITSD